MANMLNYAVLRFIPDKSRGESANIGLVVFHPEKLDVRLLLSAQKIRSLNPNVNVDVLYSLSDGLDRLFGASGTDEERYELLRNVPLVDISDMGKISLSFGSYEERVQSLMDRLVKTPAIIRRREKITKLENEMKIAFSASKILAGVGEDINSHRVVSHFPIAPSEELYADFALKNGVMHITAILDYRVDEKSIRQAKRGQAAIKAITLDSAVKKFGRDGCVPLAVFAASDETRELIEPQLQMLNEYASRIFDFSIPDERSAYMEHILKAAYSS